MFVQNLTKNQQCVLVSLSKELMKADGIVDEREEKLLQVIKSQCEGNIDDRSDLHNQEYGKLFYNKAEKVSLLLELIGIAHADEDYSDVERAFIRDVSDVIGVSPDLILDLEVWVFKQLGLVKEAAWLMED